MESIVDIVLDESEVRVPSCNSVRTPLNLGPLRFSANVSAIRQNGGERDRVATAGTADFDHVVGALYAPNVSINLNSMPVGNFFE